MAIYEQDVVMFETKENGDKVVKMPISRANNIEGIGRSASTAYVVGDVVYVDNNKKVALKCTTTGTTSANELDISNKVVDESVEDGSVMWEVVPRFLPAETINEIANELIEDLFVGFIGTYAGSTPPAGWLGCDGAFLNPQTYTRLFGRIGTAYGGDGSTTFKLPNLGSKIISEVSTGDLAVKGSGKALGITDGTHNAIFTTASTGAIYQNNGYGSNLGSNVTSGAPLTSNKVLGITTDGSKSGMVVPVTATKTTVKYCIKY